ncbi:hypothetical protein TNCV_3724601 [Trichonephila clavipes]|nr:hypothetical protein TNCV_3724601 [Trichonephila clavipes]
MKKCRNDEDLSVVDTVQTLKISRKEGLKAVETTLQHFKQQSASVEDLLFLCRLRDEVAKRREQYGRQ